MMAALIFHLSDCTGTNLMVDGSEMYPGGFHPARQDHNKNFTGSAVQMYTRTQRPPRYYWIDFGLSIPFDVTDQCPRAEPVLAGDKSAPEYQYLRGGKSARPHNTMADPFPSDIYYLGNLVRRYFMEVTLHCLVLSGSMRKIYTKS